MFVRRLSLWVLVVFCVAGSLPGAAQQAQRQMVATLATKLYADIDVQQLAGKSLVILPFRNRTETELSVGSLQDKLITACAERKLFQVVAREQFERVLKEMSTQDKMPDFFDRATQARLGKLLAAQYLLVGSITLDDERIAYDAQIVCIETGTVIAATSVVEGEQAAAVPVTPVVTDSAPKVWLIAWSASEFTLGTDALEPAAAKAAVVRWLVEDRLLGDARDVLELWRPEITRQILRRPDAFVSEITARQEAYFVRVRFTGLIREMVAIFFGKITPRLAIDTKEVVMRRQPPDPAVQTALASAFTTMGFQVVDTDTARMALLREAVLQANAGDAKAAALIEKTSGELHADIVGIGDSFAEERTDRRGFDARVEFRLVEAATARVLASIESTGSLTTREEPALDPTSNVLAKKSLQKATELVLVRSATEILKAYGNPVYRVRIWKIGSFENRLKLVRALERELDGATITPTTLDLRGANVAVITIRTKRTADQIAEALATQRELPVTITGIDCRSLICEVK
jgi:curli biogenesis system outer membrane secretion channel CsgG